MTQVQSYHDAGHDGLALFTPSPADRQWATAASLRGCWSFTRSERVQGLLERVRHQQTALTRLRADLHADPAAVASIDQRLARLATRARRFATLARSARRAERDFEALVARDAMNADGPRLGLLSGPMAELLATAGHDDRD